MKCEFCLDLGIAAVTHYKPQGDVKTLMACECHQGKNRGLYLIPGFHSGYADIKRIKFDMKMQTKMNTESFTDFWLREHKKLLDRAIDYWCDNRSAL